MSRRSGKWEVLPSIMYGSFTAITSPSLSSSTVYGELSRTVSTGLPNWPTTMRPWRSAMRGNSSACSRMTGLTAVVTSTRSISWRMFFRAFSMMSRVTWSMSCSRTKSGSACRTISLCLLDQDVSEPVYSTSVARLYHRRGVVLHHDRGTRHDISGAQLTAVVDRRLHPSTVEKGLLVARDRARGVFHYPVLALQKAYALDRAESNDADRGDLKQRIRQVEVVALPVCLLEPSTQKCAVAVLQLFEFEGAGDLDVLQVVAAVGVQVEPLVVVRDSFAFEPLVRLGDEPFNRFS